MYLSKIEVEKSGKTVSIFTPQRDQFLNRPESKLSLFGMKMGLSYKLGKLSPQLQKRNGSLFFEFRK